MKKTLTMLILMISFVIISSIVYADTIAIPVVDNGVYAVAIPGVTLNKGAVAQTSVYHYANIPGASSPGIYNAQSNWIYTLA